MNENKLIRILAISGSLRADSSNTTILKTIVNLAPAFIQVDIFNGLAELPFFSPELDNENSSTSVTALRKLIAEADGVIISTPEYAFGVPGVLKNALDWLVSSGELNEKPVFSISASPLNSGGEKALASLLLTLIALGTVEVGRLSIPNIKNKINANKEIADEDTLKALKGIFDLLVSSTNNRRQNIDRE
jgi:chromate reductase